MAAPRNLEAAVEARLEAVREAEEALAKLGLARERVEAAKSMIEAAGLEPSRFRGEAARLREAVAAGTPRSWDEASMELCRSVSRAYLEARLGRSLEPDTCLAGGEVKLVEAILEAAGPARDIVKGLLAGGAETVSGVAANAAAIARAWSRLAGVLSKLIHAVSVLERHADVKAAGLLASAAALAEKQGAAALPALEALAAGLSRAAAVAEEADRMLVEATGASRTCGSERSRLPCRLLDSAAAALAEALQELKRLARIEAPEDAGSAAAAAEARLRDARRSLEALHRLYARLVGGPGRDLQAETAELLEAMRRHSVSPEEEEVLEHLASRDTVDLMELHTRDPRLSRAALRLCVKKLAHCTVSL